MTIHTKIPKYLLILSLICWILPLISEFFLEFEYEFLWFIYIIPALIFSYYKGLKGGLITAITGSLLQGIVESINYFNGEFEVWWLQLALSLLVINFLTAVAVGLLSEKFHKLNDFYKQMAFKDGLTGAYNHRHFHEKLKELMKNCNNISLFMIDLDNFKTINDTYGHPVGDNMLVSLNKLLFEKVGEKNIVCRYGGDEFAIILPGYNAKEAYELAINICNAVDETTFIAGGNILPNKITISVGVSHYPTKAESKLELIETADKALYIAKKSKNMVVMYQPNKKKRNRSQFANKA